MKILVKIVFYLEKALRFYFGIDNREIRVVRVNENSKNPILIAHIPFKRHKAYFYISEIVKINLPKKYICKIESSLKNVFGKSIDIKLKKRD